MSIVAVVTYIATCEVCTKRMPGLWSDSEKAVRQTAMRFGWKINPNPLGDLVYCPECWPGVRKRAAALTRRLNKDQRERMRKARGL